jgi:hypothetical protein
VSTIEGVSVGEVDGINTIEKGNSVLFLTHDDVYKTKKGKELFPAPNGGMFEHHSPIRKYFDLKGGVGKECEYTDLTNPDDLPASLVKAIRGAKFVGIGYSKQLLSEKGIEKFDKEASKKADGDFYATTKIFWDIFKASKTNRAEAWM